MDHNYSIDLVAKIKLLTHREQIIETFSQQLEQYLNSEINDYASISVVGENILHFTVPKDYVSKEEFLFLINKTLETLQVKNCPIIVTFETKHVWDIV